MDKDSKSKIIGILLLILVGGFMFWVFSGDADKFIDKIEAEERSEELANDIVIFPKYDANRNAILFLVQMKKKEAYHNGYDVYYDSDNLHENKITEIYISEGAYKFFRVNDYGDDITGQLRNGQGKQFYECVKICLSEEKIRKGSCSCGIYFMGY